MAIEIKKVPYQISLADAVKEQYPNSPVVLLKISDLSDVPSIVSKGGKYLRVNNSGTRIDFVDGTGTATGGGLDSGNEFPASPDDGDLFLLLVTVGTNAPGIYQYQTSSTSWTLITGGSGSGGIGLNDVQPWARSSNSDLIPTSKIPTSNVSDSERFSYSKETADFGFTHEAGVRGVLTENDSLYTITFTAENNLTIWDAMTPFVINRDVIPNWKTYLEWYGVVRLKSDQNVHIVFERLVGIKQASETEFGDWIVFDREEETLRRNETKGIPLNIFDRKLEHPAMPVYDNGAEIKIALRLSTFSAGAEANPDAAVISVAYSRPAAELLQREKTTKGGKGDKGDPGAGVPAGGTTGQVLSKKTGTDFDTQWTDPAQSGTGGTSETPASIKTKYESNDDTNAFTDSEKTKVAILKQFETSDIIDGSIRKVKLSEELVNVVNIVEDNLVGTDLVSRNLSYSVTTKEIKEIDENFLTVKTLAVTETAFEGMFSNNVGALFGWTIDQSFDQNFDRITTVNIYSLDKNFDETLVLSHNINTTISDYFQDAELYLTSNNNYLIISENNWEYFSNSGETLFTSSSFIFDLGNFTFDPETRTLYDFDFGNLSVYQFSEDYQTQTNRSILSSSIPDVIQNSRSGQFKLLNSKLYFLVPNSVFYEINKTTFALIGENLITPSIFSEPRSYGFSVDHGNSEMIFPNGGTFTVWDSETFAFKRTVTVSGDESAIYNPLQFYKGVAYFMGSNEGKWYTVNTTTGVTAEIDTETPIYTASGITPYEGFNPETGDDIGTRLSWDADISFIAKDHFYISFRNDNTGENLTYRVPIAGGTAEQVTISDTFRTFYSRLSEVKVNNSEEIKGLENIGIYNLTLSEDGLTLTVPFSTSTDVSFSLRNRFAFDADLGRVFISNVGYVNLNFTDGTYNVLLAQESTPTSFLSNQVEVEAFQIAESGFLNLLNDENRAVDSINQSVTINWNSETSGSFVNAPAQTLDTVLNAEEISRVNAVKLRFNVEFDETSVVGAEPIAFRLVVRQGSTVLHTGHFDPNRLNIREIDLLKNDDAITFTLSIQGNGSRIIGSLSLTNIHINVSSATEDAIENIAKKAVTESKAALQEEVDTNEHDIEALDSRVEELENAELPEPDLSGLPSVTNSENLSNLIGIETMPAGVSGQINFASVDNNFDFFDGSVSSVSREVGTPSINYSPVIGIRVNTSSTITIYFKKGVFTAKADLTSVKIGATTVNFSEFLGFSATNANYDRIELGPQSAGQTIYNEINALEDSEYIDVQFVFNKEGVDNVGVPLTEPKKTGVEIVKSQVREFLDITPLSDTPDSTEPEKFNGFFGNELTPAVYGEATLGYPLAVNSINLGFSSVSGRGAPSYLGNVVVAGSAPLLVSAGFVFFSYNSSSSTGSVVILTDPVLINQNITHLRFNNVDYLLQSRTLTTAIGGKNYNLQRLVEASIPDELKQGSTLVIGDTIRLDLVLADGSALVGMKASRASATFNKTQSKTALDIDQTFTEEEKEKLSNTEEEAQANVQSDWDQIDSDSDAYIQNKPIIPKRSKLTQAQYDALVTGRSVDEDTLYIIVG